MPKDLRTFIRGLGSDLLTVEREVDPVNEWPSSHPRRRAPSSSRRSRATTRGGSLMTWCGRGKVEALAMGSFLRKCRPLSRASPRGTGRRVQTRGDGARKERIFIGEKANIFDIPITKMSNIDAGRFIGSGMNITKDPETGNRNVACLEDAGEGPEENGGQMAPRHTWVQFSKYEALGRDMPMAVAIGHHPAWILRRTCRALIRDGMSSRLPAGSLASPPSWFRPRR